ncbi:hypothetical protein PsorP6_013815 [Peronosclerospora sorghi]|uniref:Uncharacterized protein n=1 Tax=Peronosclerospora sorghi TaxID=230839 RepID=A0ACC0VJM2_9STRA|nr:hypothetical protein PsorP6_013815 [Peronosclerospora sorghi]
MRLHPTFYVGRLKPYHLSSSYDETQNHGRCRASPRLPRETCNRLPTVGEQSGESLPPPSTAQHQPLRSEEPCSATTRRGNSQPPLPLIGNQGNKRYILERLISKRSVPLKKGQRTEYLVRWLGYPPEFDSWEPIEVLRADVPDLLTEFEKKSQTHNAK